MHTKFRHTHSYTHSCCGDDAANVGGGGARGVAEYSQATNSAKTEHTIQGQNSARQPHTTCHVHCIALPVVLCTCCGDEAADVDGGGAMGVVEWWRATNSCPSRRSSSRLMRGLAALTCENHGTCVCVCVCACVCVCVRCVCTRASRPIPHASLTPPPGELLVPHSETHS